MNKNAIFYEIGVGSWLHTPENSICQIDFGTVVSNDNATSFNASFPEIRLSRRRAKDKQWTTQDLKKSSSTKAKLYKQWLLTKSEEDEEKSILWCVKPFIIKKRSTTTTTQLNSCERT
jgi:hypothetical protein